MYREYCYDLNYNFYHFKDQKLTKITRKEYKEKTGESDYIIDKLRNSRWPTQQNDYFFLKVGRHFWPIDWKLYKLIKYFRDNNIYTSSSHQGKNGSFILFNNIEDIEEIKKLFGEENVKVFPNRKIIIGENISTYDKKVEEKLEKDAVKYHDKIRIYPQELVYTDGDKSFIRFRIDFNSSIIEKMYKKLGLKMPKHSDAHKGRRIIHTGRLEKLLN